MQRCIVYTTLFVGHGCCSLFPLTAGPIAAVCVLCLSLPSYIYIYSLFLSLSLFFLLLLYSVNSFSLCILCEDGLSFHTLAGSKSTLFFLHAELIRALDAIFRCIATSIPWSILPGEYGLFPYYQTLFLGLRFYCIMLVLGIMILLPCINDIIGIFFIPQYD